MPVIVPPAFCLALQPDAVCREEVWAVFGTYILFVPCVTHKHGLVLAQGPRLTVVLLPWSCLTGGMSGGFVGP